MAPKLGHNRWTRDRVKLLQSPYFSRLPCPPPPLPTGILYSPQFRSHLETKMAAVGLNDRHLRSNGKIGDCEQSSDISGSIDHYLGGSRGGGDNSIHPWGILRGVTRYILGWGGAARPLTWPRHWMNSSFSLHLKCTFQDRKLSTFPTTGEIIRWLHGNR